MPAQPTWFPRLTQIVAELRALETVPFLERQAFERIFRVKDRRARVLMSRFDGTQIGNAWVVDRHKLIQALEANPARRRVSVGPAPARKNRRRLRTGQTRAPGAP